MCKDVIYLRAGGRRPVTVHMYVQAGDIQSMPPMWWCGRCGAEVYTVDTALCRRCIRQKEESENEQQ